MSIAISSATAGAAAAAAKRRREQQEEEDMTGYGSDDLSGWEFKIVRSTTGRFKNPTILRQVLEEEARAGWELLEKFDDSRIRFKRRIDKRQSDAALGYDAYRTSYGIKEGVLVLIIVGAVLCIVLGIALFAQH
jgi:hypothetical protein